MTISTEVIEKILERKSFTLAKTYQLLQNRKEWDDLVNAVRNSYAILYPYTKWQTSPNFRHCKCYENMAQSYEKNITSKYAENQQACKNDLHRIPLLDSA